MKNGSFRRTRRGSIGPEYRGRLAIVVALVVLSGLAGPSGAIGGVDSPTIGGVGEAPHALSRDGSVHLANGQVSGVDALVRFRNGAEPEALGEPAREVAMSADASVVAALDAGGTLRVFGPTGASVPALPIAQPISNLVMSGNGRYLGFAAPPVDAAGLLVYRFDLDTSQLLVLPAEPGETNRPVDLTDDGSGVLVWRGADPDVGQLGVFDVEALTLTKVTVDPIAVLDAALAPDGSAVLFASSSALVGGVSTGVHLFETTLADRLIRLAPLNFELNESVEISAAGRVVAQRSAANPRVIQVMDRGAGTRVTISVAGAGAGDRVTPVEISDDGAIVLVDIESCNGSVCRARGSAVSVATGAGDSLALRWLESDRPLFDGLDRLYLAVTGRRADTAGRAFWVGRLIAGDSLESVAADLLSSAEGAARFGDGLTPEAVVAQALASLLGRSPTVDDITAVLAQSVDAEASTLVVVASQSAAAATATGTSPAQTSQAGQLIRLYRAVFGRFPDQGGYRYWAAQQADGLSLNVLIDLFMASAEFEQRFGSDPSDAEAIAGLYLNVLGRAPDASGAAYWSEQLANGASRSVMLHAFVDSSENIRRTGTQP